MGIEALRQLRAEEVTRAIPIMRIRPRWFLLCFEGIGHSYEHLGVAEHVARLLGRPGR